MQNPFFKLHEANRAYFEGVLESLSAKEPLPSLPHDKLALRCTIAALSVAVGVLEYTFPNAWARAILFTGGTCSHDPEKIASDHQVLTVPPKTNKDATRHLSSVVNTACKNGHVIDIFSSVERGVGLHAMQSCCNKTGGHLVLTDSFGAVFKESFKRVFDNDVKAACKIAFSATLEVKSSQYIKVCGAIGPCISMNVHKSNVSKKELGIGGTCQWKFCALDTNTTPAIFFEVDNRNILSYFVSILSLTYV